MNKISFCISTHNNLNYLKLAVKSVRELSYYKNARFIIHAENCTDGTNEWLLDNDGKYEFDIFIEKNNKIIKGIGGGMNFCAKRVTSEYIMFLHSDFYVSENWDLNMLNVAEKHGEKSVISAHRLQPNIFNENSRPGTVVFPKDIFGEFHHNFKENNWIVYAKSFVEKNKDYKIEKGEGVSFLIRKSDWDYIGGNDPLFAPASYEDMDLFIRMQLENYKFILTGSSLVYHFGARGSHFPNDNLSQSSNRQIESERKNIEKWMLKWKIPPKNDSVGFISSHGYEERYKYLKNNNLHNNYLKLS